MAAHGQPAAGFKIKDSHIGFRQAGLCYKGAGHIVVASGLVGQQFAEPVLVFFHVDEFFCHRRARYMGKTSYDIAGRLSEGMGFDGPENFFSVH